MIFIWEKSLLLFDHIFGTAVIIIEQVNYSNIVSVREACGNGLHQDYSLRY